MNDTDNEWQDQYHPNVFINNLTAFNGLPQLRWHACIQITYGFALVKEEHWCGSIGHAALYDCIRINVFQHIQL